MAPQQLLGTKFHPVENRVSLLRVTSGVTWAGPRSGLWNYGVWQKAIVVYRGLAGPQYDACMEETNSRGLEGTQYNVWQNQYQYIVLSPRSLSGFYTKGTVSFNASPCSLLGSVPFVTTTLYLYWAS